MNRLESAVEVCDLVSDLRGDTPNLTVGRTQKQLGALEAKPTNIASKARAGRVSKKATQPMRGESDASRTAFERDGVEGDGETRRDLAWYPPPVGKTPMVV